jgi:hypothetical protein
VWNFVDAASDLRREPGECGADDRLSAIMTGVSEESPQNPAPQPARVRTRADLARELERLRAWAARGSGRRRVSLERIAGLTGIPRSTVHSYVRGTRLPPADALDRIVQALGAAPAEQAAWAHALERAAEGAGG